MDFVGCCKVCVSNAEFVKQFNRITGNHLGERRNPIEIAIDQACGYDPDKSLMQAFCTFVFEYVWVPMTAQCGTEME
ncbi:hypothetical protein [Intestinibacillus sp. Marseille-P6563]|uniref:hypothetical protein n=1 Tax=Intestinibacillus sp. Marseille-P6563 TaxID=2364792 RepID=UPI000F053BBA|nr:hypothetical protein [Intestinibacillus sp. Marseille-P6563]